MRFFFGHIVCSTPAVLLIFSSPKLCSKSRKCGKTKSHVGKCDSKRKNDPFWKVSQSYQLKKRQGELAEQGHLLQLKQAEIHSAEKELCMKQGELDVLVADAEKRAESSSMVDLYEIACFIHILPC